MVLPTSGSISIAQIADEFGISRSTPFPGGFYGLGGASGSGPLKLSDFYGRFKPTPTPTPAPSYLSSPQITPSTGTAGATTYTIEDPVVANGSITARDFVQGSQIAGTGNATIPPNPGDMYWRAKADGPGGTTYYLSNAVSVLAPPSATTFDPDGGYVYDESFNSVSTTLTCTTDATWTYSTVNGAGGSVNLSNGGVAKSIRFTVTAAGPPSNRVSRSQRWSVRGVSNGVQRDFTVELTATGDNVVA